MARITDDPTDPELTRGADEEPVAQAPVYLVAPPEARAAVVRPVRASYVHEVCGAQTYMSAEIAQTYAADPAFYGSTYCVRCQMHRPVGPEGEFVWADGTKVGT
jgi:hypothetical protein